jgi:hypothetical protein
MTDTVEKRFRAARDEILIRKMGLEAHERFVLERVRIRLLRKQRDLPTFSTISTHFGHIAG